ncbi:Pentatricopeptide repeat [Macleaya cordata]|uniref:Pentatricopeptide repeat n=1 Tax=Macleaya cordata TaxID=56857 RepID=A0A200QTR8_MACCD|nr:Pentatricopeptide repeat [Macleaya cordata]
MQNESVPPLNFTVSSILKGLAQQSRLRDGEVFYGFLLKSGFDSDQMVQNSVLDLFSKCGKVDIARRVFDEMVDKDTVSWNSMISGYGNDGFIDAALDLFDRMPEKNVVSWTAMICGYVKVGDMAKAGAFFERMPFRDTASWNVMLSGYMDAGDLKSACRVFEAMPDRNVGSWNLMVSGFCKAGDLDSANDYFVRMPRRNIVSWSMMIDGFVKIGNINKAKCLFDQMPEKNLISWSTMISGYAKSGQPRRALELFEEFKEQGIEPDETFIMGIISACSQLGILDRAEEIVNVYVVKKQLSNLRLVASLIDMYAKCGSVEKAMNMFEKAYNKDLFCYSTMITAFANHGMGEDAISLFDEMLRENIKPDGITFLGVLTACNHGGLVNEGKRCFKIMTEVFGIQPLERHYSCMVDLLGRAGCLDEAYNLIRNMNVEPSSSVWGSLLAACRSYNNIELAEIAAGWLFEIEPDNSGNYVLLSNIFASAGRWDDVGKVRAMIRERGVRKNRGSSWIELNRDVHEFVMGDLSHVDSENIYAVLHLLSDDMKISKSII